MVPEPITITEKASIAEAIDVMKRNSIRHLPVVAEGQRLRGFLSLADLKLGLIPSLVGTLTLSDLMITDPITVGPDDDVEIAAQRIYKHKIGGMPVVQNGQVVGIITETDILRAFIDMMGMLTASSRIDVVIPDGLDASRRALETIHANGGDIINVGMTVQTTAQRIYYFRLSPCKTAPIARALEREGFDVLETMD